MKISTKGRYGLRILLDLALHEGDSPRMIRDIAESQQISEKYIRQSLAKITLQDIVDKTRENAGDFLDYCI